MTIELGHADTAGLWVDRDGTILEIGGPQGFDIHLGNNHTIHFTDERDAMNMAKVILDRMGITLPGTIFKCANTR